MRIIFCGTPEFAVPSLHELLAAPDIRVEAVITQPDRPRGRGQRVQSSPVRETALAAGLHVFQPEKIRSDSAFEFLERVSPDAVVIIAYGQIVPQRMIDIPRFGWINLHGSLLPKYRGAAPIQRAILAGETHSGLTTMQVDVGLDTGPTLLRWETQIGPDETSPELSSRMAQAGAPLLLQTLRKLNHGELTPVLQDHSQASPAPLLKRKEARINWSLPSQQIYNHIRALQPWPGSVTTFRGRSCHITGRPAPKGLPRDAAACPGLLLASGSHLLVHCGMGTWLALDSVKLEGRKRVSGREFVNGVRLQPGECFVSG